MKGCCDSCSPCLLLILAFLFDLPALLLAVIIQVAAVDESDDPWFLQTTASIVLSSISLVLILPLACFPKLLWLRMLNFIWQCVMLLQVINVAFAWALIREAMASVTCSDAQNSDDCIADGRYVSWILAVVACLIGIPI